MFSFLHILYHYTIKESMDWLVDSLANPWRSTAAALLVSCMFVLRKLRPRRKAPPTVRHYEPGTAYLHMFPRCFTKHVVNLSPYAIKVETWCRMNNVPYEVVETSKFSSKEGQIPYLILDGQETANSPAIIAELSRHFSVPTPDLTQSQRGVHRAVARMLDDSFAVLYFWYRYHAKADEFAKCFSVVHAPGFVRRYIHSRIGKGLHKRAQIMGISRYGLTHVIEQGERDLLALEDILGDSDYFLGSRPTELDATVFCHLTQVLYPEMPYPWKSFLRERCPRLVSFADRMKSEFWPDWDSLVSTGQF